MNDMAWAALLGLLAASGCVRIAWYRRAVRQELIAVLDAISDGRDVLVHLSSRTEDGCLREEFRGTLDEEPYVHRVETRKTDGLRKHGFEWRGRTHRSTNRDTTPLSRKFQRAHIAHLERQLEWPAD